MENREELLLAQHAQHLGLYTRVAKKLRTSPAYVALVANGARKSDKIIAALIRELRRIDSL